MGSINEVEESQCVILAVIRGRQVGVPYNKEVNTGFGMAVRAEANLFDKAPSSVELVLVAQNKRILELMIVDLVEVDGEEPRSVK